MEAYFEVLFFMLAGLLFYPFTMVLARLFRPSSPSPTKLENYECGVPPIGQAQVQFHPNYYLLALLFVALDVEAVFLFPWAVHLRELGLFGLVEMFIFIGIIVVGIVYAWKKKVIQWH